MKTFENSALACSPSRIPSSVRSGQSPPPFGTTPWRICRKSAPLDTSWSGPVSARKASTHTYKNKQTNKVNTAVLMHPTIDFYACLAIMYIRSNSFFFRQECLRKYRLRFCVCECADSNLVMEILFHIERVFSM